MRALARLLPVACLVLTACVSAPADRLAWREAWNLVIMDDGGLLIEAELSRANTGLLRGQGHLAMTIFPRAESAVVLRRTTPPGAVSSDPISGSIDMTFDRLEHDRDGWTLHVREGRDALDATLHLTQSAPELAPTTMVEGQRQWVLGVPVPRGQATGAWRAGEQGGLIRGQGVLVRQSSDTWPGSEPARTSLYLITPERSIGVEQVGERSTTWVADSDGVRTGTTASIQRRGRQLDLSLEPDLPITAQVRLSARAIVREPWDHLLPFERLLARLLADWPLRTHQRGRAEIRVADQTFTSTALLVHGADPPAKRRRRAGRSGE